MNMSLILRSIKIFILALPVMVFLNTGFYIDGYWKVIQAVIFTLAIVIILIRSSVRRYVFILGLIMFIRSLFLISLTNYIRRTYYDYGNFFKNIGTHRMRGSGVFL